DRDRSPLQRGASVGHARRGGRDLEGLRRADLRGRPESDRELAPIDARGGRPRRRRDGPHAATDGRVDREDGRAGHAIGEAVNSYRMSRYRLAWWFGLGLLVLITGLLTEHYRSVREI